MKLFKKSEVSTLKANERLLEVQQGMKLSKRVDALREVVAAEEASLEAFRVKTVKAINDEIEQALATLTELRGDVKHLREEIADGTKILDKREEELTHRETELDADQSFFEMKIEDSNNRVAKLNELEKANANMTTQLRWQEAEANRMTKEAHAAVDAANAAVSTSHQAMVLANNAKAKVEADLVVRETVLADRELQAEVMHQDIETSLAELANKEREIIDKYATLEAAIKHSGGHKIFHKK